MDIRLIATVEAPRALKLDQAVDFPSGTRLTISIESDAPPKDYLQQLEDFYASNSGATIAEERRLQHEFERADVVLEDEGEWW